MARLVISPEDSDIRFGRELGERFGKIATEINATNITSLLGDAVINLAEKAADASLTEVILWATLDDKFRAAWTSTPPQADIVQVAVCESHVGLVAEVFSSRSSRSMEEPLLQASNFTNLSERRGKCVVSMQGLPVLFFDRCIGVLTEVRYETSPPATADGAKQIGQLATIFGRSAELNVLKMCLGLDARL